MNATKLRFGMNLWLPFLAAGIRVVRISADYREVDVELRSGWLNMNYFGTHFGGSMFAMTDPFFAVMLMNILGRDYTIWDKAASIDFIRPGEGRLTARFRITDAMLADIAANTRQNGDKYLPAWPVEITDAGGGLVARVEKTLYIRRRKDDRKHIGGG